MSKSFEQLYQANADGITIESLKMEIERLTAERDALARCKLADQDAYVAMRDQRDAALADAKRWREFQARIDNGEDAS